MNDFFIPENSLKTTFAAVFYITNQLNYFMKHLERLLLTVVLILASAVSYAQTAVSGTVIDATGEPVIGATVMEKGTSNGTVTDFDGNFTLKVDEGKTLVFTYIGFEKQELPAAKGMRVTMRDNAAELAEVVVTGYTTQRNADLTGAVSTVSVSDLQKQNENNPIKAMQGRVPGMNISANGNPRGIGTLNSGVDPLYIIDGVPTTAGMHELNGNDIESIQVLKDAASASIYGSRAANGVIIITTKRGKEGKVKVDFDASVSASHYVSKIETLNASEWGRAYWQACVNDGKNPSNNNLGYNYDWGYDKSGNPVLNKMTMNMFLDDNATVRSGDTDWFDEITRTGVVQQYNMSVSSGSEKGNAFFSLGYYDNKGTIKETPVGPCQQRIQAA